MKLRLVIVTSVISFTAMASAYADHNSLFGDNTGHTVTGVHDNRIEVNTHSNLNSSTMSQSSFQVQAQGSMGGYQQGGAPATVMPGAGSALQGGGGRR